MLPFTVTICGAVVMCLEILAFRVIEPSFGSRVYVTGSIIGVFLAALSLGYYLGGLLADRHPDRRTFAGVVVLAGVLAAAIPWVSGPLLDLVTDRLGVGPWSACCYAALVFGPSGSLFGMISPFAVRLSSTDLSKMGNIAGRLYALSTFGSIFGTLFTSFYLINWFRVSDVIRGAGLVTVALGLLFGAVSALRRPAIVALCLLGLLARGGPLLAAEAEPMGSGAVLYQTDTNYHRVIVTDDGRWRVLKFNRSPQSSMLTKDPYRSGYRYTDGFHVGLAYFPEARSALFIGCGAATGPKQFRKFYPQIAVDVVDIDPKVVEVAEKYFAFRPDSHTNVVIQDGRVYLKAARRSYDMIFVDAYYAEAVPFHLTTVEFMRVLKSRLTPEGVAVFNVIGSLEGPSSRMVRSEYRTIRAAFPTCAVFPIIDSDESPRQYSKTRVRNVIMVASTRPALDAKVLAERVSRLKNAKLPALGLIAAAYHPGALPTSDVPELTDEFAPVDNLVPVP